MVFAPLSLLFASLRANSYTFRELPEAFADTRMKRAAKGRPRTSMSTLIRMSSGWENTAKEMSPMVRDPPTASSVLARWKAVNCERTCDEFSVITGALSAAQCMRSFGIGIWRSRAASRSLM